MRTHGALSRRSPVDLRATRDDDQLAAASGGTR
jgi:hypothetical protein